MTRRVLTLAAVAAGIALLVWQVRAIGWGEIARGFSSVGWLGFAGVLALSFARFLGRGTAWLALLREPVPLSRAVAAFLAGDAAGNLTPLGLLASEPAKAAMLGNPGGLGRALAALAAETYFFSVSVAAYVVLGTAALIVLFPLDRATELAAVISLSAMAVVLVAAGWVAWTRPAAMSAALSRLRVARMARLVDRVRAFETTLYGTVGGNTAGVRAVIAAETTFHVLSFGEMWLTLWLVTGRSMPLAAFVLDAFGRVANIAFKMIPLQLGVLQVGSEMVGRVLGLAPGVGTTLSLIRTARVMVWAAVGLALATRNSELGTRNSGTPKPSSRF
jgi:hypothetical protein